MSILRYFETRHLRHPLNAVSLKFFDLAQWIADELPEGAEKSTALRKLLEAKDAAVRSALDLPNDVVFGLRHLPYNKDVLTVVLIEHQRTDVGSCDCGNAPLGISFAEHIVKMYERAVKE